MIGQMKIPLHKPLWGKSAEQAVIGAMRHGSGTADGPHSAQMRDQLQKITGARFALPVTNCTQAMEIAVACLGTKAGDEVIVPSFTLASTATAVMRSGGIPVFADIDAQTYCLDPADIERKITKKTVGIITVHYAGMAGAPFDALLRLAKKYKLWVVEDAAHCIGSEYKKKSLGLYGQAGAFSFHGTKNVACGEGGAVVTNNASLATKMEVFRAIGTDRAAYLAGKVSIYQWVGEGSSYFLSDILAALANVQLDQIEKITRERQHIASRYTKELRQFSNVVQLPIVPTGMTKPNWHIYALKFRTAQLQKKFIEGMRASGIEVSSHYVPLHSSPMGRKISKSNRSLPVTEDVAKTIVRMPIYAGMTMKELQYVVTTTKQVLKSFLSK